MYTGNMKGSFIVRAFFGLMIVALGGGLLAHNLGIITIDNWGRFWSILWGVFWGGLCILAGISAWMNRKALLWCVLLCAIGVTILLTSFLLVDITFWKVLWPLIIIGVGVSIIFRLTPKKAAQDAAGSTKMAMFYSEELRPKGTYEGNNISAVFGSVDLDLRQAKIKDGTVIDVFVLFGGVDIMLPSDVIVKNDVRGIFGGSDDKTAPDAKAKKTVTVQGECLFGGLTIK